MESHTQPAGLALMESVPEASARKSTTRSLWDLYRSFVHKNQVSLELFDAGLSRILFWAPTGGEQRHRNREVLYGILSLHRLAMDTALQQLEYGDHDGKLALDYGMTVRPNPESTNGSAFLVSPSSIRIAITVLQSLLPSILELSRASSDRDEDDSHDRRQRHVRVVLERIKFALRLVLMGSYWKHMTQQQTCKAFTAASPPMSLGIMTEGGLFRGLYSHDQDNIPTIAQEDALWQRKNYVGRRTGRTCVQRTRNGQTTFATPQANPRRIQSLMVVLGEILYAYRPLYWANAEVGGSASYRHLLVALAMDLVSLQCTCRNPCSKTNSATQTELSRRKMRLLLYLLRTPMWDRWTQPASDRVEDLLDRVPLLGRLASTYLRDWLWFMKHPYEAEQG